MRVGPDVLCFGRRLEGIVFDVDGTLTDSIECYYEVFREVTARQGIRVNREDVLEPMATGTLIWDRAIPKNTPDRERVIQELQSAIPTIFRQVFQRVRPFPGLDTVLSELRQRAFKLGAVTSSWKLAVQPLIDHGLVHHFGVIVTTEDGFAPKPAPDSILGCLRRMNVHPAHALTVGDTPLDIRAGKAAGTMTIGVLSGIGNRAQLEAEAPTAIMDGIAQIVSVLNLR
jgi:HAD superfamily hydrolase (TIGR01509 family)